MGDENGSRSGSKSKVGEKRSGAQFGEKLERRKRVKMRDLDSVCRSEEMIESNRRLLSVNKEKPQESTKDAAISFSEIAQTEIISKTIPSVVELGITSFDLNSEIRVPNHSTTMDRNATLDSSKGFTWHLNANDKFSSPKEISFFPFKNQEHLKSGNVSECRSTAGHLEDKDPMRVWKEMKQNGFLSSSHASIKVPKQRGRKRKSDGLKKKMELAKKEQMDKYAKIAAPSGLLNELNPGIINHVRNRKQVHSIIEALVKLEKHENHQGIEKQFVSIRSSGKDDDISGLGATQLGVPHDGSLSTSSLSQHTGGLLNFGIDQPGRDDNTQKVERWFLNKNSYPLQKKQDREDDVLVLKLASATIMASEDISSLSNEQFANLGRVSSLSVKAANVAFRWLELLQQDIKGRLAALRHSKNRVQSAISTELPFLMSREFSGNRENDSHVAKNLVDECSPGENANAHRANWSVLFDQMDKTLSQEEKQLEIWLHQVKEMHIQCGKGLHWPHYLPVNSSQRTETFETEYRLQERDKSERELAVRAAAASIYSTCNLLSLSKNLSCY